MLPDRFENSQRARDKKHHREFNPGRMAEPVQQLISKGKSYEAVCISLLGGSTHLESRDKIAVMAVQPFGQLCVTMVVTKNRATMLSRSALALWGRAGIESSSNRVKGHPLSNDVEFFIARGKICFFLLSCFFFSRNCN